MVQQIVLFEDKFADRLRPVNLTKITAAIPCGALTLQQLVESAHPHVQYVVRPHLQARLLASGRQVAVPKAGPTLFINQAIIPSLSTWIELERLAGAGEPFVILRDQQVAAALVLLENGKEDTFQLDQMAAFLLSQRLPVLEQEFALFEHCMDIISNHEPLLNSHLEWLLKQRPYTTLQDGVYLGGKVEVAPYVVFDTSSGPILIDEQTVIKPFSFLQGPIHIGKNCLVNSHTALKHGTVLFDTVKVGGEVENSIIESYSNKQHHGFLGHAYLGSWVNLGAGTSNSNLKNTYGTITVELDGKMIQTNRQFVGCVVGDFSKTAINVSIFTGKIIGIASFVYGSVTTNVPSFTNYARSFGQVTEVAIEVAQKTQQRVAKRRNVIVTDSDQQLLLDLFEMTRHERQLSSDQLSL